MVKAEVEDLAPNAKSAIMIEAYFRKIRMKN